MDTDPTNEDQERRRRNGLTFSGFGVSGAAGGITGLLMLIIVLVGGALGALVYITREGFQTNASAVLRMESSLSEMGDQVRQDLASRERFRQTLADMVQVMRDQQQSGSPVRTVPRRTRGADQDGVN